MTKFSDLALDPRVLHRLAGRRVLLVDDVISTGSSALAGLACCLLGGWAALKVHYLE